MSVITRLLRTRRRALVLTGVVSSFALAGIAYAYFTTTGSGKGSATVGSAATLTLHGTTSGALYPGSSTTVNFTADNPSTGHQKLTTIHLASVTACSAAFVSNACPSGDEITSCESVETGASDTNSSNFWMADVAANQDLPPGSGQTVTSTGTLELNDLNSSQNSCQGAYLQLNLTSS